jgi:hypothetical protein
MTFDGVWVTETSSLPYVRASSINPIVGIVVVAERQKENAL